MRVAVDSKAAAMVRRGHPWIYREAVRLGRAEAPGTGAAVEVTDERGASLAAGLFDAGSPIAIRVYGRAPVDERTLGDAILRAVAARDALFSSGETTAARLCHGEGDRVPGFVLDRYGPVAVVRLDGAMLDPWLSAITRRIAPELARRGVRSILERIAAPDDRGDRARHLWGEPAPAVVDVVEHGMTMEVDFRRGQKTGAFLDQRDNRRRVRALASGYGRVLNLYSYTGGFSIAAALGGATEVTSVDLAAKAHAAAQRSFAKNGLDARAHRFVTADAIVHAEALADRGERFDLVISDPPSFAPNEKSVPRALSAYVRLHRACARLLAPGATLCAASCSSHIPLERFLGTLDDAALERSDLSVRAVFGPGEDHPTLAAFPEGRYLKFVVLR
jgi:23S rRNA (cytosine1962-C5)-methyltransferase